ncbi:outer membrane beta-barrel protein [Duganella sp. BuS-21]|uniref:outer membrane beta-barrel protein n=1 Tax=Duganella sp. BuS-21 TaxID=2943848 RepID=UPI0035A57CEA
MSNTMLKVAMATLIAAGCGSAVGAEPSPVYVGADAGTQFSNNTSLLRAYAGYKLGAEKVYAVELMVFTLGTESRVFQWGDYSYSGGNRLRANGIGVNWASALPLNENWTLTSRLGGNYAHATTRSRYAGGDSSYDRGGVTAGVGLAYRLNPNLSLTVDLSYMPVHLNAYEKNTRPTLGTGLRYNF